MSDQSFPPMNERLSLKQTTGWFPAGDAFRKALAILSDGAFRLFAYLCLEADRRTGRFQATHKELALAMGKSKRAIGSYIAELEARGICHVQSRKEPVCPYDIRDLGQLLALSPVGRLPRIAGTESLRRVGAYMLFVPGLRKRQVWRRRCSGRQGPATTRHSSGGDRGSYARGSMPEIQFLVRGQRTGTYPKPALLRSVDCRNPEGTITLRLSGVSSRKD